MLQSHRGTPAVPEQGTPTVPERGTPAVPEQGMPMQRCGLWQRVLGQRRMVLLAWGFGMRKPAIPPAETGPA